LIDLLRRAIDLSDRSLGLISWIDRSLSSARSFLIHRGE